MFNFKIAIFKMADVRKFSILSKMSKRNPKFSKFNNDDISEWSEPINFMHIYPSVNQNMCKSEWRQGVDSLKHLDLFSKPESEIFEYSQSQFRAPCKSLYLSELSDLDEKGSIEPAEAFSSPKLRDKKTGSITNKSDQCKITPFNNSCDYLCYSCTRYLFCININLLF